MQVEILSADKTIYSGEAALLQLPGLDGSFEILDRHAPMIAALAAGKVKVQSASRQDQFFEIGGGMLEVLQNKVIILAE